jgi:uncharacterized membrane protein YqjE
MEAREPGRGLLGSMRVVAGAAMALASTRLELAATELEEERLHLAELALWATLALFCAGVGTVFAGLQLVLLFWNGPRELALGTLTAAFLLGGALAARTWRHKASTKPPLLAATLAELRSDGAALDGLRP